MVDLRELTDDTIGLLQDLERLGARIEALLRGTPGTLSVYAERVVGGNYLDFDIDRREIARYWLTVGDVQDVIQSAIGGMNVTWTVEGLERYPVNLRYPRELRDNLAMLRRVLVVETRQAPRGCCRDSSSGRTEIRLRTMLPRVMRATTLCSACRFETRPSASRPPMSS